MIPAMTPSVVHTYLRDLGTSWSGKGIAIELGCWLGATTVPLLQGLQEANYQAFYWAFDRWIATKQECLKALEQRFYISEGQDLLPVFMQTVEPYGLVHAVKGNLPGTLTQYNDKEIEFCLFDAPKKNPVFIKCMEYLLPYFIPGVTIIGLLDYYSYTKHTGHQARALMAPVNFIHEHAESFSLIKDWPLECSCAFFKYEKSCLGQ